jgi:hypothetical protein
MAIVENNPSARMQIKSRGQLVAPACCCVCGNATHDEGYLDFGAFVEFHGTLYFCKTCITQGAETFGMFTADEVKHLQDHARTLLEQKTNLEVELAKANEYINNFDNLLRSAFADGSRDDLASGKSATEPTERSEGGEPEVKEPTAFFDPQPVSRPQLRDITFE